MKSNLLKSKRVAQNLYQTEIANKLNMSIRTYNLKENGKLNFRNDEMMQIKEILNLSMEDIKNIFFE